MSCEGCKGFFKRSIRKQVKIQNKLTFPDVSDRLRVSRYERLSGDEIPPESVSILPVEKMPSYGDEKRM